MDTGDLTILDFAQELATLRTSIKETESVREQGLIGVDTRDVVVENAVVRCALLLENLIETLFAQCLLGRVAAGKPYLRATSMSEVGLLLHSSARQEAYLTWLPYKENTAARADSYLQGGGPFARLNHRAVEMRALQALTVLRNAVAHDSAESRRKFQALAKESGYRCSRPADYLVTEREGVSEVRHLIARVERIGQGIVASTDTDAERFLEAESAFSSTQKVPRGVYQCEKCDYQRILLDSKVIGSCPRCVTSSRCEHCGHRTTSAPTWIRTVR